MNIERGSVWRKWDFHVHTPYSILNNNYGVNPYEEKCDEAQFDAYVVALFTKAVENGVAAIGITDYFSIDGYKRILNSYINNEEKMLHLFPDDELRSKVYQILLLPNIEMRTDNFVGKGAHAVNYHVIFSNTLSPEDIEECFLNSLQFPYQAGKTLPLTRRNIERLGAEYRASNGGTGSDYRIGLERVTVSYKDVSDILGNPLFKDKYLITIPVDEDLSSVKWDGRDYSTRKVLYQQCHCLMTSNPNTRRWALAKGHEEDQIREFLSIKPCIWGSDAHEYERMFAPADARFCWIKAEPTFEGLRQILYEPEERVIIQKNRPDEKDPHQVIDYVQFENDNFQTAPIYLSEELTCIIGGKSTGKSMLLRHIARAIAPAQVKEREQVLYGPEEVLNAKCKVYWKDGTTGERKIIYIPQSWLNRVVDQKEGDSALNKLLSDILLQQDDIGAAHRKMKAEIAKIIDGVKRQIEVYVTSVRMAQSCEQLLQENGRSEAFEALIAKLTEQREELSREAGITPEMLKRYAELEARLAEVTEGIRKIKLEEVNLEFHGDPFVYIPLFTSLDDDDNPNYCFDAVPTVREEFNEAVLRINGLIAEQWSPVHATMQDILKARRQTLSDELEQLTSEFQPLKEAMAINDQLKRIDDRLVEEKRRLISAQETEQEKKASLEKAEAAKKEIIASRRRIFDAYSVFCTVINSANREDTQLVFNASTEIRRQNLFDTLVGLFDNRGFRPFKEKFKYNLLDIGELVVDDLLFESIWEAMSNLSQYGALALKSGNNMQTALERMFSDWYHVHFTVKSGNDTINNMSPGKKALVLLELIINIERGNCPILIDQPEDDLDNRSIYADLVQYLKQKKHERQIIVVTHNANVVVGSDAEEVVIANQDGQGAVNCSRRFEYRCGSIENVRPVCDEDGNVLPGILNQKGIQEQICDILEGGRTAFKLRSQKYFSKE